MRFLPTIGIEIHIELNTKSKMFSSAPVTFGEEPNTKVAPFDMAFPGTMPTVNKQAVIHAIRVANALNMDIADTLIFDRKNYFYSDLPKGFQITQELNPLGRNGFIEIKTEDGLRKIGVERLHLEEDTCKQIHYSNYSLLDYNRAGIPLIEIVSKPEIKNADEAVKFVEKIRSIVSFLGASNGKMEEGSLRCDINVSLSLNDKMGTKVEIKNLNSLSNIQKSIDYEINRQTKLLENGANVEQESRRFDEKKKETVKMRIKEDAIDYKYFIEPNIPPIKLSKSFIEDAISTSPLLAEDRFNYYKSLGLSDHQAKLVSSNKEKSDYYDELLKCGANPLIAANWLNGIVQAIIKENSLTKEKELIVPSDLCELLKLIESKKINNTQAKELFIKIVKSNEKANKLIVDLNIHQINDEEELRPLVNQVLDDHLDLVNEYKNGRNRILGYLIKQVLMLTNEKANPSVISKLIIEEIKRR